MTMGNKVYLNDSVKVGGDYPSGGGNSIGMISGLSTTKGIYAGNLASDVGQEIWAEDNRSWTISGTNDADKIHLGSGGGTAISGNGADTLFGGDGKDIFKIGEVNDATHGNATIKYYTYGTDKVMLGNVLASDYGNMVFGDGVITGNAGATGNFVTYFDKVSSGINKVTLTDGGNDANIWFTSGTNAVNMNAGDAKENIYMRGQAGKADTLIGGAGKDTIQAFDGQTVWGGIGSTADVIELEGAGNHVVGFGAGTGSDTVTGFGTGFAKGNDALFLFENAIGDVQFGLGKGNATVTMGSDKLYFENIKDDAGNTAQMLVKDAAGDVKKVWFGNSAGENVFAVTAGNDADYYLGAKGKDNTISFNAFETGVVVDMAHTGQFKDDRVYQNIKTIVGGTGSDTIIGATDVANILNGGAGDDHIWGKGDKSDTLTGGSGKDTFYFGAGDGKDFISSDSLGDSFGAEDIVNLHSITGLDSARAGFDATGNAFISLGSSDVLTFAGTQAANDYRFTVSDAAGTKTNVWLGKGNVAFNISEGNEADLYISNGNGTLNLAGMADKAFNIDLRDGSKYINVANIQGSDTASTLIGSGTAASLIQGGTGNDSIYGGSKENDTLAGATGTNMFFFDAGDGQDVVTDYKTGDSVKFWGTTTGVNVNKNADGNVVLSMFATEEKDTLTLKVSGDIAKDAVSTIDVVMADNTKVKAMIGQDGSKNKFAFAADVNAYYGGNDTDTLKVTGIDNAEIWLDNRKSTFYTGIETIDAAEATGDMILAGAADVNNTIKGGQGTSSLWGGAGKGNDVLIGGSGTDVFYYGMDEGNDVIQDGSSMDKVMVYSPNFAVKSTELKSGNLIITTANDNTLTVKGWDAKNGLNTFELADGTKWGYNEETKAWDKK